RVPLSLSDESDGTRTWLRLIAGALDALEAGAVLLIDEIDASLHPRLTARLIGLFRDERTNGQGAQLIFTTHDATLLGTSFGAEILGRDEVWFIEKGTDGGTRLFSLSEFRPRKGENTERRYLGGSYGAVPAVFSDTLVEQLLTASREPSSAEA
ncbi:MAG TPA: ATP-binding protein, partial [Rugosimonospora sp.]|nr:ATP-binding protein [Rugosimonospora sp.]